SRLQSLVAAIFGQADWAITERLHVLPGLRYNYDRKDVRYNRQTYGGLQTNDPDLLELKRYIDTDQAFTANVDESNLSGQLTVSFKPAHTVNSFATISTSYKPVGVNLGGLPVINGEVATELAQIKPEYVTHIEIGVNTTPTSASKLNLTFY